MAVKCYINKIEYPIVGDVEITDHAAATSESTLTVDIRGLPEPRAFDAVYLFEDGQLIYGGICAIPQSPIWDSPYTPQYYQLTISGMNSLLTRRYINKAWSETNLYQIIIEIYERIISAENIALGMVSSALINLPRQTYIVPDMTAYDVLTELAGLVGAIWNIEPNRASTLSEYLGTANDPMVYYAGDTGPLPVITPFEFYDTPSFKPFRFTFLIREDFPRFTPNQYFVGLQKTTESYDVRTVQVVKGASGITDPQTEIIVYAQNQKEIEVSWPVVELPVITVNGTTATVGVKGVDNDNEKQFLFSYNSTTIEINESLLLQAGAKISVTYRGFFELRARAENRQAIEELKVKTGTSGRIEAVEQNDRYTTAAEIYSLASNKLYQNAQAEEQITLTVQDNEGTDPFTIWSLSFPDQYINGEYVVVEKITTLSPNYRGISLVLKDKGFLTAYGTIFYQNYKNGPTNIREDDVIVETNTAESNLTLSVSAWGLSPLCCFADDGQPWLWEGYIAKY